MTKYQFILKLNEMKDDLFSNIQKEALRLFNSGAIDTDSYENEDLLPRILLTVALSNLSSQYNYFNDKVKQDISNLKKF